MKIEEGDRKPRKAECQLPPSVLLREQTICSIFTRYFSSQTRILTVTQLKQLCIY